MSKTIMILIFFAITLLAQESVTLSGKQYHQFGIIGTIDDTLITADINCLHFQDSIFEQISRSYLVTTHGELLIDERGGLLKYQGIYKTKNDTLLLTYLSFTSKNISVRDTLRHRKYLFSGDTLTELSHQARSEEQNIKEVVSDTNTLLEQLLNSSPRAEVLQRLFIRHPKDECIDPSDLCDCIFNQNREKCPRVEAP